jgi:hypothetical protein
VFPSKGKVPLTSKLSNGDLDGDVYTCIWEKNLIFKQNENSLIEEEFKDDLKINTSFKNKINEENFGKKIENIISFIICYIKNDNLGKLSNNILTKLELEYKNINEDQSANINKYELIKLSKQHSIQVDFIKRGKFINLDQEKAIRPHYHNNNSKKEYMKSFNGFLYDKINYQINLKIDNIKKKDLPHKEVKNIYDEYCSEIYKILEKYDISGMELVTGVFMKYNKPVFYDQDSEAILFEHNKIISKYKKIYDDRVSEMKNDSDKFEYANSWYYFSNIEPFLEKEHQKHFKFLQFGWINIDILLKNKIIF